MLVIFVSALLVLTAVESYHVSVHDDVLHDEMIHLEMNHRIASEYYISNSTVNFYKAFAECRQLGLYLLTVESQEENDYVLGLLTEQGRQNQRFWTACTKLVEPGEIVSLSTGEVLEYSNWAPNEPNDSKGSEAFVEYISVTGHIFTWNDVTAQRTNYFICESL